MRRPEVRAPLCWIVAMGSACGSDTAAVHEERRDSAGVEIIQLPDVDWSLASDAVETWRIGAPEGGEPYEFFRITAVAGGRDGSIFVANGQTASVRRFSTEGVFLNELGGRGEGPGEFMSVDALLATGDTIVVSDWRSGAATAFTSDGTFLERWGGAPSVIGRFSPVWLGPDGWIGYGEPPIPPPTTPGERVELRHDLYRLFPDHDSVGELVYALPPLVLYHSRTLDWLDQPLFWSPPSYGFDAEGSFYLASESTHQVDKHDVSGRLTRRVRAPFERHPITEGDVDQVVELSVLAIDTATRIRDQAKPEQRRQVEARVREQAGFPRPAERAPLGRILVSSDGSYWVERVEHRNPAEVYVQQMGAGFVATATPWPTRWEVVDPTGTRLHAVELPSRFAPLMATRESVTGVLYDALDVEHVVRYRVRTPAEAGG